MCDGNKAQSHSKKRDQFGGHFFVFLGTGIMCYESSQSNCRKEGVQLLYLGFQERKFESLFNDDK